MRFRYFGAFASGALLVACGDPLPTETVAPPTLILAASTTTLDVGDEVTLDWSSTGADSCSASGDWSGARPTTGSQTLQVTSAGEYSYTLACSGSGGVDTDVVSVSATGNPAISLSVDPSFLVVGEATTVTWSTAPGQTCTATEDWSGTKAASGSESVTITRQGENYIDIYCDGPQGKGFTSLPVYATAVDMSLTATPDTLTSRGLVTLEWSSTNAASCLAQRDWRGTKDPVGTQQVRLTMPGAYSFYLECGDFSDLNSKTVTVQVNPEALAFNAFPNKLHIGDPVTLSWTAQDAANCTAGGAWSGELPAAGTQTLTVAAAGTSTFEITCGDESRATSVFASVAPALPPATNYRLTPDHAGAVEFTPAPVFPGSPAWTVGFDAELAQPLIAEGLVFVASENPYFYGMFLHALDADDGTTVWGPIEFPGTYWYAMLAYDDGRLFVLNGDGVLRAFEAATGTPQWSVTVPRMYLYRRPPTAMGGRVFVSGSGISSVAALDASNGDLLWHSSNGTADASPTVVSSGLYLTSQCAAWNSLPATGALIWRVSSGCSSSSGNTVPVRDGRVYAYLLQGLADGGNILDAASGAPIAASRSAIHIPAVAATRYFVVDQQRVLHGVDIATNEELWSFAGDGLLYTSPIVINDRVVIASSAGNVYAVDAATGIQQWAGTTGAGSAYAPLIDGITAGEGWLAVPAGNVLRAWKLVP
jgi:outer membrane protein assembly factor BamB/plastocyanin